MSTPLELPFTLGDTYWAIDSIPSRVEKPCPACFGSKTVRIICGDGSEFDVACEGCDTAEYLGRTGKVWEWVIEPRVKPFTIAGVTSMHDGVWTVVDAFGNPQCFTSLYATETEAMAVATARAAECIENNMMANKRRPRHAAEKATWTLRYAQKQIADAERTIAWHRARITQVKEGKK